MPRSVSRKSRRWLDDQPHRAWKRHGPAPGLPALLARLGFRHPTFTTHKIISADGDSADPWPLLEENLERGTSHSDLAGLATQTHRRIRAGKSPDERQALRALSRFNLTPETLARVLDGVTRMVIESQDLPAHPYDPVTCTINDAEPIAFETVNHDCFPDLQLAEHHPLPLAVPYDDPNDRRRNDPAMTTVQLHAQNKGHTLRSVEQMTQRPGQLTNAMAGPVDTGLGEGPAVVAAAG